MPSGLALGALAYQTVWVVSLTFVILVRADRSILGEPASQHSLFSRHCSAWLQGTLVLGDPLTPAFCGSRGAGRRRSRAGQQGALMLHRPSTKRCGGRCPQSRATGPTTPRVLAQEILSKNPSQPNALHLHGYALLMQERAGEAIAPARERPFDLLRDPGCRDVLNSAIALRKAGRTDDALGRLARAVKRKPPFPAALHEYAYLLHSLGRTDEAIDVLKAGMDRGASGCPTCRSLLGWIFHARNDAGQSPSAAFARALGYRAKSSRRACTAWASSSMDVRRICAGSQENISSARC